MILQPMGVARVPASADVKDDMTQKALIEGLERARKQCSPTCGETSASTSGSDSDGAVDCLFPPMDQNGGVRAHGRTRRGKTDGPPRKLADAAVHVWSYVERAFVQLEGYGYLLSAVTGVVAEPERAKAAQRIRPRHAALPLSR